MITQLSVFLENESGRILSLTESLKDAGVDILSLNVADTKDFGIVRLIVRDIEKATDALKIAGFAAKMSELLGVRVADRPGGLFEVLSILNAAGENVEYVYSYVQRQSEHAVIFLKVSDPKTAIAALAKQGIGVLDQENV
ncbi:MAG: hypothetical protein FWD58_10435 [Firmicutes bacterium]|nr:hypothetical protein [Bacillota bacterium]